MALRRATSRTCSYWPLGRSLIWVRMGPWSRFPSSGRSPCLIFAVGPTACLVAQSLFPSIACSLIYQVGHGSPGEIIQIPEILGKSAGVSDVTHMLPLAGTGFGRFKMGRLIRDPPP